MSAAQSSTTVTASEGSQPSDHVGVSELVERRILRELRRPMRLLHRIRLSGVTVLTVLAVWLLASRSAPVWGIPVALAVGASVFALFLQQARANETETVTMEGLRWIFIGVIVLQTCAIALTGGIRSPLLVAYVPSLTIAAVLTGAPRVVAVPFFLSVACVAGFMTLHLAGGGHLLPLFPDQVNIWLFAVLIPLATLVGSIAGTTVRSAFGQSVRAEAEARARSVAAMQARNQELMALSSSLAHELKNPLAAIQGLTMQQARKAEPGSREAERLEVVVSEVQRMGAILEEFLSFSRPLGDLSLEPVRVSRLLDDLAALYEDHARAMGVELQVIPESEAVLHGDRRQLQHVLVNLVQNALDASGQGGHITLSAWREEGHALIEVSDEGEGLDPELEDRVFEFGATSRADGSGIGLAIARSIVQAHGGELTLSNQVEHGAIRGCLARIRIPLEPDEEAELHDELGLHDETKLKGEPEPKGEPELNEVSAGTGAEE